MKWYKKQLDTIKKLKSSNIDTEETMKKTTGYTVDKRKKWVTKKKFPNPVAASNLRRPKTDSL